MLKIKDNVDLKELEKYGFEHFNEIDCYVRKKFFDRIITIVSVWKDDNSITSNLNTEDTKNLLIGDLIKDGLVEKVEE